MRPDERRSADAAIREAIESLGYEVLRLTIANDRHVCVTMDSERGAITIADATRANYRVRDALREAGLPVDDYAVEVESAGIRRPLLTLRHFERFVGERARLKLRTPRPDGSRNLKATIAAVEGSRIRFELPRGETASFVLADFEEAILDPETRA